MLGTFAFIITISVGVTLGIISALRQYSKFDNISTGFSFFSLSIPQFWFALILQLFFAITLTKWFKLDQPFLPVAGVYPPGHEGFDPWLRVKHLILPALVVAFQGIAIYSRYMRASMLEVMNSDYMRTARSKGISEKRVIMRHGFRNALLPVVTYAALDIGAIVGGLVITEAIFEYPGHGTVLHRRVQQRRLHADPAVDDGRRVLGHPLQPVGRSRLRVARSEDPP